MIGCYDSIGCSYAAWVKHAIKDPPSKERLPSSYLISGLIVLILMIIIRKKSWLLVRTPRGV